MWKLFLLVPKPSRSSPWRAKFPSSQGANKYGFPPDFVQNLIRTSISSKTISELNMDAKIKSSSMCKLICFFFQPTIVVAFSSICTMITHTLEPKPRNNVFHGEHWHGFQTLRLVEYWCTIWTIVYQLESMLVLTREIIAVLIVQNLTTSSVIFITISKLTTELISFMCELLWFFN